MQYSVVVTSAMLSALTMPFILNFAHSRKLYDIAGGRKNHNGNIPRLGGLGMFLAFATMVAAFSIVQTGPVSRELWSRGDKLWPFAVGAVLMHTIGLMDDLKAQPGTAQARSASFSRPCCSPGRVPIPGLRFQGGCAHGVLVVALHRPQRRLDCWRCKRDQLHRRA